MQDFSGDIKDLSSRLAEARSYLKYDENKVVLADLEKEMARSDLWDDPEEGKRISSQFSKVGDDVKTIEEFENRLSDISTLAELASEESDESQESEIRANIDKLASELNTLELRALFADEYDEQDAVCEVHAGAGGTEAQDWADMLLRMYTRWAERRGFAFELDEITQGNEAGILSATFIIKGRYAYGLMKAEKGTHRLVRISPFDSQSRRHTSFASIEVIPFVEDVSNEIEIDENDLRIDTYRASGAGGQHVNKTDSAIRITHIPTGIVVTCQNERSQLQNRTKARQILAAKLLERQREERQAELSALSGNKTETTWGTQIRSYVLAPYQLVKDLRTDHETGNVQAVLDGDLDEFMESYLRWLRAN